MTGRREKKKSYGRIRGIKPNKRRRKERSQERKTELECRINERKHGRKRKRKEDRKTGENRGNDEEDKQSKDECKEDRTKEGRGQIERKGKDGRRGNVSARRESKEEEKAECLNQAV